MGGGERYNVDLLPILIIPGFMSSGLEIHQSKIRPGWKGKRIWINLGSLGFQSIHFGSGVAESNYDDDNDDNDDNDVEKAQHKEYKSTWLQHMVLGDDLTTERDGVKVRPIPGLSGVDYLTPGSLTNHVSYVFGPLIRVLVNRAGYKEGVNIDAASYDWRIAPSELEKRDGYFTNTMRMVEELYARNNRTPVVLLCHSLGCKVGHYFLNFCLARRGQDWIDRHIHTYMPVGGPHLGAPRALRAVLSGTKMSLDAFLNDDEALSLGRSLGSGAWLFPQRRLPPGAPTCLYLKPQGVLHVTIRTPIRLHNMLRNRRKLSRSKKFKLSCVFGDTVVTTPYIQCNTNDNTVRFSEKFFFATRKRNDRFQILLLEPGVAASKKNKRTTWDNVCCCFCCLFFSCIYIPIKLLGCFVSEVTVLSAEAVSRAIGGNTILALSESVSLSQGDTTVMMMHLYRKSKRGCFSRAPKPETVEVRFHWQATPNLSQQHPNDSIEFGAKDPGSTADPVMRGHQPCPDLVQREGLDRVLNMIRSVYESDPLDPRGHSSSDPPPVHRIKAIYGVNLPTEVGSVYSLKAGGFCTGLQNFFQLDKSARIESNGDGYLLKGGILEETQTAKHKTRRRSGDGTVPYWSLQHVRTWANQCHVTVDEIEKAEHRDILADDRFHQLVLQYVRVHNNNKSF